MKRSILAVVLPIVSLVLAASASAGDWARFRGPDGAGVSDAKTVPVTFTEADYNWRVKLPGPGHSSPCVSGGRIYTTCFDANTNALMLVCLDATTGKLEWTHAESIDPFRQHRDNNFAAPTPCADDRGVYLTYVSKGERFVFAVSHEGVLKWKKAVGSFSLNHGAGASPIVVDGVVIVPNDHEGDDCFLVALDSGDGSERWRMKRESSAKGAFATPSIYRRGEEVEVIFSSTAHGITSVKPATGKVNWEMDGLFRERCVHGPVVAGDVIFQTAGSGGGGKESAAVIAGSAAENGKPAIAFDMPTRGLPYVPSPVVHNDRMYLWADSGIVTCADSKTGKQVWQERIDGAYYSSPVCIDGKIYNISKAGQLVVIDTGDALKELARINLGEASFATPAVADGTLYLRTLTHMISVGGEE